MITIPEATVLIGAPEEHLDALVPEQHYGRPWFEDESPQHPVTVKAFLLDRHPVTNAQFREFTDATGYCTAAERRGFGLVYGERYWLEHPGANWRHPGGSHDNAEARPEHPVVHVDHADASAYAQWAGKRLPTEPEWEYAAHGTSWRAWPWGNIWDPAQTVCADQTGAPVGDLAQWRAWWETHYAKYGTVPGTAAVGSDAPAGGSPLGISDMAGNVSEWTSDTYKLYDPARTYEPIYHAAAERYRVVRGGGWMHFRYQIRTTERFTAEPSYSNHALGFRCALDATDSLS
ncbi:formylglycine-generating enzyme family protein [Streptomyces hygroscopicus]|uniref:formylglycine-generating enzyme family protein n=1 Tax=Streptomyces hygroscopicus TaxID=1912 RepID=UPI001FCA86A8|nr:SUMF1/EgtB/PvdO family nonheme iron enzyme [Streptomyces hygroscopicus]BDH10528.1 hypothetical protein HOK021_17070 [Streptomyces hygroscopicus]